MSKNLKILSVMHKAPNNSGFLAEKFVRLSKESDMHMLIWDNNKNISAFSQQYGISQSRLHNGIQRQWQAFTKLFSILYVILFNDRVRKYLLGSSNTFSHRLKLICTYLPVFYVKPNIIHFEFGTLALHIAELQQLLTAKICVSFRGYDINYVGLDNTEYYKDVWLHADGIHFLGNDLKKRALKRGYKNNKIEALIPAAIDTTFFTGAKKQTNPNSSLNIYSTGRLIWKKGYEYALLAMAILKKKNIPFHYHLIGDGDQNQALQFTISELGLEHNVTLHGRKTKDYIKQALLQADVFIQPSISEGFCNAVLEAQAMAVPVIATDADGLAENIIDGTTGFIVPKWNAEAIAERIMWFHNNQYAIPDMGAKGAERVQKHFDIKDQVVAFIDFYKKLHEA
jgi:colanic acid/amylovoran biosynthesis glycosyltransferase